MNCYSLIQHSFEARCHFLQFKKQSVTCESAVVTKLTVGLRLNFESISTFCDRNYHPFWIPNTASSVIHPMTHSFPLPFSKMRGSSSQQSEEITVTGKSVHENSECDFNGVVTPCRHFFDNLVNMAAKCNGIIMAALLSFRRVPIWLLELSFLYRSDCLVLNI